MRTMISGMVMALALVFASFSGATAGQVVGRDVVTLKGSASALEFVQYGRGRYHCEELRRACEYKERLGEQGQGNCRRYREECGRPRVSCEYLRRACIFKDERGETGAGNCRRYREECRGGGGRY